MKPSVIILTYNSESSIVETLRSIGSLSDDIHVVDSFSTDRTVEIAHAYKANVVQHPFETYGTQRNWSIAFLPLKYDWQLHLDADERLTCELRNEIMSLQEETGINGFYLPRLMYFLGHPIRHGGLCPTWHLRLFRSGVGMCETCKYDQHFYLTNGQTRKLKGWMIDDLRMPLSEWTIRHNRWSDTEVEEQTDKSTENRIVGKLTGDLIQRKKFLREKYNACPLFFRPFGLFFYRYVIRLGFLDGSVGFVFYVLQTFWFRFLIDSKLLERRLARRIADPHRGETQPVVAEQHPAKPGSIP